jgi:RND family efflux transporter MFP subunit
LSRAFIEIPLALLAAATLAGCGKPADTGPPQGPAPVTVATPLIKPIVDWDEYIGRFEAVESVDVRPRVSGYIQSQNFRDGQFVARDQLLFVVDPRPFKAALDAAQAQTAHDAAAAELARSNLTRAQSMMADKAISQEEFDTTKAAAAEAQAQVAADRAAERSRALDLEYTRVTAPVAGRASDHKLSVGNYVTAGQTVLTSVVSLNPIRFAFEGSEAVYLKYQRANRAGTRPSSRVAPNPVEIRLQDETDYRWRGRMEFVDNQLDTGSGAIRGRAVVANPDGFLTPGMFGHMRLLGSGAYDAMLIPDGAVTTDQSRKIVFVVGPDGAVAPHVVTLGPLVDGLRVVRSGLSAQDRIIIEGVQRIHPGVTVKPTLGKITPPAPGEAPAANTFLEPPAAAASAAGGGR